MNAPQKSAGEGNGRGRLGMREIAARVGVSPITVSRALKDPGKVSPETRAKILEAIEHAGFIPNQMASSMRSGGRIIGTMVPPLINSGIAEQVQGMSDEAHASGYQMLLMQGDFGAAAEEKAIRALLGWRPAGLILQAFVQSPQARRILSSGELPVVEISETRGRRPPPPSALAAPSPHGRAPVSSPSTPGPPAATAGRSRAPRWSARRARSPVSRRPR